MSLHRKEPINIAGPSRLSTSALAAIIPRFAWPNKPSRRQIDIENFTEIDLNENTSMNIGWAIVSCLLWFFFCPSRFLVFKFLLLSSFCSYRRFDVQVSFVCFVFGILSPETVDGSRYSCYRQHLSPFLASR